MSYLALYRVHRPQRFEEVVGQDKIVKALQNALREDRLSHAYLFAGPRGTGKTSIAKIVAKAVNCESPKEGEPCNQCASCRDINNGTFMDVVEIDAASNRGIDEMRDLREKVRILPAQGKRKVYIIDEVHMLTTEAFNALLKTLEEPPSHVIFILATTEPQRIPATIKSRCQIYYFRRLTLEEIAGRLKKVSEAYGMDWEEDALYLVARRANGGLRDALSIMDQVYAYKGERITKQDVLDVLGVVDDVFLAHLLDAVLSRDMKRVIEMLGQALNEGKEAQQLARETVFYLRDLLLYKHLGDKADFYVVTGDNVHFLEEQKGKVDQDALLKALRIMMNSVERLKFSEGNRFLLEMAFLEMMDILSSSPGKLVEGEDEMTGDKKPASGKSKTPVKEKARDEGEKVLWQKILAGVKEKKIPTHALLSQGKFIGIKDDVIYIGFKKGYRFHKERMEERGNREILEEVLAKIFKKPLEIQFIFLDDDQYNDIMVKKAIEYFGEDVVQIRD
ncbi:DNA polymerase-3 subunit gamma/tau [Thermosyntropha lipolytica DSM 11003]|uniref:DNA-directed DNA polymerase n=1 Tax=Thermosyntropha lipolytica DSM 11003 TaxID=1123382 RepID=A0A1M5R9C0_9FIRM|nr:DNA polymerase III subunit gamma/tau [Thermosyntropha lipolytica]SHH22944.1 DNA polymerase-3 subunit gamma/tau [Thermosyntropha lipolytica DSM 11003]